VDGHRELLETRNRAREQGAHLVVVQGGGRELLVEERDARVGEDRVDRLETPADRRVRVALPEEGEDLLSALVQKGGGKRERRIVGRLEPELDDDPRRAVVRQ
jgi:hypothetical protein